MQKALQQRQDRNAKAGREQDVDPIHVRLDPFSDLGRVILAKVEVFCVGNYGCRERTLCAAGIVVLARIPRPALWSDLPNLQHFGFVCEYLDGMVASGSRMGGVWGAGNASIRMSSRVIPEALIPDRYAPSRAFRWR